MEIVTVPGLTGARDNLRFLHVKFRVQHVVRDFFALEHSRKQLARFHGNRADENRLRPCVAFLNLVNDRVVFLTPRLVDAIVRIFARDRPIRRNNRDIELIDVVELVCFRFGRARHAGQFLIKPEIILNRDGSERLRFAIDLHAFLCFHRLMQPVAPAAPRHLSPGIFVNDHDFVFFHHVLHILFKQAVGAQQL